MFSDNIQSKTEINNKKAVRKISYIWKFKSILNIEELIIRIRKHLALNNNEKLYSNIYPIHVKLYIRKEKRLRKLKSMQLEKLEKKNINTPRKSIHAISLLVH